MMGQSTEMSPLVSLLFRDIPKSLGILTEMFNMVVYNMSSTECRLTASQDMYIYSAYLIAQ